MDKYIVSFSVNGKTGNKIIVEANNPVSAKRVALGELNSRAGYADKKISVTSPRKVK